MKDKAKEEQIDANFNDLHEFLQNRQRFSDALCILNANMKSSLHYTLTQLSAVH